jgi:predicted DCC family thiol-disulfide oxidoreductase YuxK
MLLRRNFHLVPLQARWAQERLGLTAGEPLAEMKLVSADGRVLGGADAMVEIAGSIWWMWPLWTLAQVPGVRLVLRRAYRRLAANRYCFGRKCEVTRAPTKNRRKITSKFYELP